jgi:hypothetical protein
VLGWVDVRRLGSQFVQNVFEERWVTVIRYRTLGKISTRLDITTLQPVQHDVHIWGIDQHREVDAER